MLVRSGDPALDTGSYRNIGYDGMYWSSTPYLTLDNSYYFGAYSVKTHPSYQHVCWFGVSIRCLNG